MRPARSGHTLDAPRSACHRVASRELERLCLAAPLSDPKHAGSARVSGRGGEGISYLSATVCIERAASQLRAAKDAYERGGAEPGVLAWLVDVIEQAELLAEQDA